MVVLYCTFYIKNFVHFFIIRKTKNVSIEICQLLLLYTTYTDKVGLVSWLLNSTYILPALDTERLRFVSIEIIILKLQINLPEDCP
jgi:hypothetical protein